MSADRPPLPKNACTEDVRVVPRKKSSGTKAHHKRRYSSPATFTKVGEYISGYFRCAADPLLMFGRNETGSVERQHKNAVSI